MRTQDEAKAGTLSLSSNNISSIHDSNLGFDLSGTFPNMTNMNMGELNPMLQFMQNGMPNNLIGQFPNAMGKYPLLDAVPLASVLIALQ